MEKSPLDEYSGFPGRKFHPDDISIHDGDPIASSGEVDTMAASLRLSATSSIAVAVRVPRVEDEMLVDALRQEAKILCSKNHENIGQFMGACVVRDHLCLIICGVCDHLGRVMAREHASMPLHKKIFLACDVAFGMAWLHSMTPPIIHRSLKPRNLLVRKEGNRWRIVITDFTLATIQKRKTQKMKATAAVGTPIYMAPEIMLEKGFTQQVDVYSFGIILWELLTGQDAFSEFSDYETFVKEVGSNGYRPHLPEGLTASLVKMLKRCWHANPSRRPTFEDIADELSCIAIECAIKDHSAREFWLHHFTTNFEPTLSQLTAALYNYLGISLPLNAEDILNDDGENPLYLHVGEDGKVIEGWGGGSALDGGGEEEEIRNVRESTVKFQLLCKFLSPQDPSGACGVSIAQFSRIVQWFGPLKSPGGSTMLDTMLDLAKQPWFHGNIGVSEAVLRLRHSEPGTFLVRFSGTPGAFAITRKSQKPTPSNVRITRTSSGQFNIMGVVFDSLQAAIKTIQEEDAYQLVIPCPGSPYQHIVRPLITGEALLKTLDGSCSVYELVEDM